MNSNNNVTPIVLLVDNGSIRADATKQLRILAKKLSVAAKIKVQPVSLRHADKISAELLDGEAAQVFLSFMDEYLLQGERKFIILPLFFAEGRAVTELISNQLLSFQALYTNFTFQVADVVYPLPNGEPLLVDMIYDLILKKAEGSPLSKKNIVLVDHGSPQPRVTEVRKHLAKLVQKKLSTTGALAEAVMERRKGDEYLFNGELLQDWLTRKAQAGEKSVIVCLLFFLAGRHAGKGGDIDEICRKVEDEYPKFKIAVCPLIAEHKELVSILLARLQVAQQKIE